MPLLSFLIYAALKLTAVSTIIVRCPVVSPPPTADASLERHPSSAERVVGDGSHLASLTGAVSVTVVQVVPRLGVVVVTVHVITGHRVLGAGGGQVRW